MIILIYLRAIDIFKPLKHLPSVVKPIVKSIIFELKSLFSLSRSISLAGVIATLCLFAAIEIRWIVQPASGT